MFLHPKIYISSNKHLMHFTLVSVINLSFIECGISVCFQFVTENWFLWFFIYPIVLFFFFSNEIHFKSIEESNERKTKSN